MVVVSIILGVLLCIAIREWFIRYVANAALLWYIQEKGLPLPSDEDMKAGTQYAAEHLLKDLFQGKH